MTSKFQVTSTSWNAVLCEATCSSCPRSSGMPTEHSQLVEQAPERLLWHDLERLVEGLVSELDAKVRVQDQQRVADRVENGPSVLERVLERLLGPLNLLDIGTARSPRRRLCLPASDRDGRASCADASKRTRSGLWPRDWLARSSPM